MVRTLRTVLSAHGQMPWSGHMVPAMVRAQALTHRNIGPAWQSWRCAACLCTGRIPGEGQSDLHLLQRGWHCTLSRGKASLKRVMVCPTAGTRGLLHLGPHLEGEGDTFLSWLLHCSSYFARDRHVGPTLLHRAGRPVLKRPACG